MKITPSEDLYRIISLLEDWQLKPATKKVLALKVGQSEINSAKSRLLRIASELAVVEETL